MTWTIDRLPNGPRTLRNAGRTLAFFTAQATDQECETVRDALLTTEKLQQSEARLREAEAQLATTTKGTK